MTPAELHTAIHNANNEKLTDMMRLRAVESLAFHLARGGEVPFDAGNLTYGTVEGLRAIGDTLAASVRVAIEYGDLSALEGEGIAVTR